MTSMLKGMIEQTLAGSTMIDRRKGHCIYTFHVYQVEKELWVVKSMGGADLSHGLLHCNPREIKETRGS